MKTKLAFSILLAAGIYSVLSNAGTRHVATGGVVVIDGDTLAIGDERYRLLGFDTPETFNAQCDDELALGQKATRRLKALIGQGDTLVLEVSLKRDRYQRKLARALIADQDVADIMISEGLARAYGGGKRQPWCNVKGRLTSSEIGHWGTPQIAREEGS